MHPIHLSKRASELPISNIGEALKIAAENPDIISFGPGEPDFPAPPAVLKRITQLAKKELNHYSPLEGQKPLREEIAKHLKIRKFKLSSENILITAGSTEGLFLSLSALVDTGEGVLIPDPGFLAYHPMVELLNGTPLPYALTKENDLRVTYDSLNVAIHPEKTKAIIVNSPSNPTGTIVTKADWKEITDFVIEHDLILLSDEAYESFIYGSEKHISPGTIPKLKNHVISLFSFSKTFAMPGYRVGYLVCPPDLQKAMAHLHVLTSISPSTFSQHLALTALKQSKGYVQKMRKEYEKRRTYCVKRIQELNWPLIQPNGAFYLFPDITQYNLSSYDFSNHLLKKAKVSVLPGTEFGKNGEGFIRMSFATSFPLLEEGFDRIEKAKL